MWLIRSLYDDLQADSEVLLVAVVDPAVEVVVDVAALLDVVVAVAVVALAAVLRVVLRVVPRSSLNPTVMPVSSSLVAVRKICSSLRT